MRIVIEAVDLPGRSFCDPDGAPLGNVHVGVQIRREPADLVPGDADAARWDLDVSVTDASPPDFRGPAVHGRPGDRFLYLTWGDVDAAGGFAMFRRAKLMLAQIDEALVAVAGREERPLVGVLTLTDAVGGPRCGRVDPPAISWHLG